MMMLACSLWCILGYPFVAYEFTGAEHLWEDIIVLELIPASLFEWNFLSGFSTHSSRNQILESFLSFRLLIGLKSSLYTSYECFRSTSVLLV